MINPFTSSHQNYLFRKNYQSITRSNQPKDNYQSYDSSAHKLSILQAKNPFKNQVPIQKVSPNHNSTSRTLSTSRVGVGLRNNSPNLALVGKTKLLDEDSKWKRELQKGQRQRLQYYGAEGLRYNSQTYNSTVKYKPQQKWKPSDYNSKPSNQNKYIYQQRNPYKRQFEDKSKRQQSQQYYKQKERPPQSKKVSKNNNNIISSYHDYYVVQPKVDIKHKKQTFQDDFDEDLISQLNRKKVKKNDKGVKNYLSIEKNEQQNEQEQSKLVDMFGSCYDERFKQEMKQNSFGSHPYSEKFRQSLKYNVYSSRAKHGLDMYDSSQDRMKQSKATSNQRGKMIKKFYESSVQPVIPDSIQVNNVIYYHIDI